MEARRRPRVEVRSVWAFNLDFEFSLISSLLPRFPFVAFDTEFPGFLLQPADRRSSRSATDEERYALLKANVDHLHLIQLGLTLFDAAGNIPGLETGYLGSRGLVGFVWEFNFREFDVRRDPHVPSSIELLRSNGVPIDRLPFFGIDSRHFARCFVGSGLVAAPFAYHVPPRNAWVTFHGCYDYGYLLKVLGNGRPLPATLDEFIFVVRRVFGRVLDVKYLMSFCDGLYGGLERVAASLKVRRPVGRCHQAGSDSLLAAGVFLKMRSKSFRGNFRKMARHDGIIFGLQVA